jgi:Holliday junction resolvasome RuvABC ATP-dependent DNA helicase subunit
MQIGFVIRTRQGRQAIRHAHEHLGLPYHPANDGKPAAQATLF